MTIAIDRGKLKQEALTMLGGMASRKSVSFGLPCWIISFFAVFASVATCELSFLMLPIGFGPIFVVLDFAETGDIRFSRFWSVFSRLNYLRVLGCMLLITAWTLLWSLLFVIPGVVKAASYSLSGFILAENPQLGPRESIELSMMMMHGYRWQWIKLRLSLLGWALLSVVTLGFSGIWTNAYILTVELLFYKHVKSAYTPEFLQECITKVTAWRKCSDK